MNEGYYSNTEQGWFGWDKARGIAVELFNFWPDGEDLIWAKQCWAALDKKGLTIYTSDIEEMKVRELVGALAIFYQEFCYQYGVEPSELLRRELLDELFESREADLETLIQEIRSALVDYYSIREFWLMTAESVESGCAICAPTGYARNKALNSRDSRHIENSYCAQQSYDFLAHCSFEPTNYICIHNFE